MTSLFSCRLLSAEAGPQHSVQGALRLREQQKGHPHQGPAAIFRQPGAVRQLCPGAVPRGSVGRSLLLGDRVERGVLHRRGLQGHQPEGQRLPMSTGLQQQVLEPPLLRHWLLRLAQPCGHLHQRPTLPQDRCVPGPHRRRAGILQHRTQQHDPPAQVRDRVRRACLSRVRRWNLSEDLQHQVNTDIWIPENVPHSKQLSFWNIHYIYIYILQLYKTTSQKICTAFLRNVYILVLTLNTEYVALHCAYHFDGSFNVKHYSTTLYSNKFTIISVIHGASGGNNWITYNKISRTVSQFCQTYIFLLPVTTE